jgi:hypothetical protein
MVNRRVRARTRKGPSGKLVMQDVEWITYRSRILLIDQRNDVQWAALDYRPPQRPPAIVAIVRYGPVIDAEAKVDIFSVTRTVTGQSSGVRYPGYVNPNPDLGSP